MNTKNVLVVRAVVIWLAALDGVGWAAGAGVGVLDGGTGLDGRGRRRRGALRVDVVPRERRKAPVRIGALLGEAAQQRFVFRRAGARPGSLAALLGDVVAGGLRGK